MSGVLRSKRNTVVRCVNKMVLRYPLLLPLPKGPKPPAVPAHHHHTQTTGPQTRCLVPTPVAPTTLGVPLSSSCIGA